MLAKITKHYPKRWLASMFCAGLTIAACSQDAAEAPTLQSTTSTTSSSTTTTPVTRETTLRVGIVINDSAPTSSLDASIETILNETTTILNTADSLRIELTTVSVESAGQAEGTMLSLIRDGVSVVITGCDDATVPAVIEAATANELLAVTGCAALPRPNIERGDDSNIDRSLFIDLSTLADNALAIDQYRIDEGYETIGVIRSSLLPDVEQTCLDLESELTTAGADTPELPASTVFAELIDAPGDVVSNFASAVSQTVAGTVDAVVICALPPAMGDMVQSLRDAGFDQPVIVPWYGDSQTWNADTTDVITIAPASRHGNDPEALTLELFAALAADEQQPSAVDVVTADALAILVDAVNRGGSVGSRRLAETIRNGDADVPAISGAVETRGSISFPLRRVYRAIEIENGEASFATLASTLTDG